MPVRDIPFIPIDSFNFHPDINAESFWQSGQGFTWNQSSPPSFTITPQSTEILKVNDEDDTFGDDDENQTLIDPITINGQSWPAGHFVENEYTIRVMGSDGIEYKMVAISINAEIATENDRIVGFTFDTSDGGEWPPSGIELTYIPDSADDLQKMPYPQDDNVICFTRGTLIETADGPRAIEDLVAGDLVVTRDNGLQPLRWIGSIRVGAARLAASPNLLPVRIAAGALAPSVPAQDLLVSPQHRMLVRSRIAQRMFGTAEILVAAKQLLSVDGIDIADDMHKVDYFHMLFDRHEIVMANGAEAESLYTGTEALKTVGQAARDEIFSLFPELREDDHMPVSARLLVSGRQGRKMAMRHVQNARALVN